MDWALVVGRVGPILVFLVAVTVVAELAERMGLFSLLGSVISRIGRGKVLPMWLALAGLATLTTAFLSLDTTAVLVTPIAIALVRRHGLSAPLFTWTTLWTANCASLLLPVANLTNLLALSHPAGGFDAAGGSPAGAWWLATWRPALLGALLPLAVLAILHRRALRGTVTMAPEPVARPWLVGVAGASCLALAIGIVVGLPVVTVTVVVALVLALVCLVAAPDLLDPRIVPWLTVVGVGTLFAVVALAHGAGLASVLSAVTGSGDDPVSRVRLGLVAALASNLGNNLPAYLALEPVADSGRRLVALLVGANLGPLATPWASVATLLWAGRCRAGGIRVRWAPLLVTSASLAVVLVVSGSLLA